MSRKAEGSVLHPVMAVSAASAIPQPRPVFRCWRCFVVHQVTGSRLRRANATQQAAVHGSVSLDDEPVDGETVNFSPLDAEGRTASGLIEGGRYRIPEDRAPTPGRDRVETSWNKPLGPPDEENPDAPPQSEQAIPARYHPESELEREIKPGENELNSELRSQ